MTDTDTEAPPQVPASPRAIYPVPPMPSSPRAIYPPPSSPRSQHARAPRTPLSPSFRGAHTQTPLSPSFRGPQAQTPLSPRGPYGQEPQTPHGFVPMRRDSLATFDPRTPMSPTFKEEEEVRKAEDEVTKIDHADLKVKFRIRIAKVVMRSVNFCCSLVVLALIASALYIFNKTKILPARNNLPPWAENSATWPQITLCTIAAVSLLLSMAVLFAYWRGGHRRAEKMSIYWTMFSIAAFIFAIVMWGIAAGILNGSRAAGNGKDIWGWACKDNKRRALFQDDINYALVCLQMDWGFICALIEISVELFTIGLYAFAFYRIASKRRLRKSMDVRDRARSELYLAILREQEGNGDGDETKKNTLHNMTMKDPLSAAEEGESPSELPKTGGGFQLQAVPKTRHHQAPVSLVPSPQLEQGTWQQANSFDPSQVPLPSTPAFSPSHYRQSNVPAVGTTSTGTVAPPVVPPTPMSVRFNITPSPPQSRG